MDELVTFLGPGVLLHFMTQFHQLQHELRVVGVHLLQRGECLLGSLLLGEPVVDDLFTPAQRSSDERGVCGRTLGIRV
ncbi:hypothetical protein ABZV34_34435 [Streptomyces sp. NPDC005195]|uniref:hypothetical protein n=1 Tax=Streptomyces sp. NPDC005195 TaxID=3154561 RepID=UPI0033A6FA22